MSTGAVRGAHALRMLWRLAARLGAEVETRPGIDGPVELG